MMPATLTAPHVVATPARSLSAPPSRGGDADVIYLTSHCHGCGALVPSCGFRNVDGVGVLTHETVTDCEPCPAAAALAFDWNTGAAL